MRYSCPCGTLVLAVLLSLRSVRYSCPCGTPLSLRSLRYSFVLAVLLCPCGPCGTLLSCPCGTLLSLRYSVVFVLAVLRCPCGTPLLRCPLCPCGTPLLRCPLCPCGTPLSLRYSVFFLAVLRCPCGTPCSSSRCYYPRGVIVLAVLLSSRCC